MKLIKLKYCAAFTVVAIVTGLAFEANAQQAWNQDYSPSCSERGGCRYGNESLELIPYGQSYGNGNASTGSPYRDSFRAPYQSSLGDYSGGCGFGGTCSQSRQSQADQQHYHGASNFDSAGRCPYEQRQFEKASYDPRSTYGRQTPYQGGCDGNPNFDNRPNYSPPSRSNLESYQQAPADQRPEMRTSPSISPPAGDGNESRPQSNGLTVPPTSTQLMPPPELPPQPSSSNFQQNAPQLLQPATSPGTRQSNHDNAGHDHSANDHSGHNH